MSLKKPAVLLAGACALAVAGCSSGASTPPSAGESGPGAGVPQSAPGATASSLPAGDADTALTPKGGQSGEGAQSAPSRDDDPARLVVIVVHLQEGADPEVTLASINEAVAGFPVAASALRGGDSVASMVWWLRSLCRGFPTISHVIPAHIFQTLKSDRWNCNVCGGC